MLGSAEDNTALSRALSQLAEVEDKMEQLHQDQAANDTFRFAELIADFIRLLGAVRVPTFSFVLMSVVEEGMFVLKACECVCVCVCDLEGVVRSPDEGVAALAGRSGHVAEEEGGRGQAALGQQAGQTAAGQRGDRRGHTTLWFLVNVTS